jgi:hypothetical protein
MALRPFRKELLNSDGLPISTSVGCLTVFSAEYCPADETIPQGIEGVASGIHHYQTKELLLLGCGNHLCVYDFTTMRKLAELEQEFNILDICCINALNSRRSLAICSGEANTLKVWNLFGGGINFDVSMGLYLNISIGVQITLPAPRSAKYGAMLVKNIAAVTTPRGRTRDLLQETVTYVLAGCAKDPSGS